MSGTDERLDAIAAIAATHHRCVYPGDVTKDYCHGCATEELLARVRELEAALEYSLRQLSEALESMAADDDEEDALLAGNDAVLWARLFAARASLRDVKASR